MKLKKKHLAALFAALVVVVAAMVMPTYSWLSSSTDPVVNSFEGGDIEILLDETEVDEYGEPVTDEDGNPTGTRISGGNDYTYLAGATLTKDPTVTVYAGSEECYVYICVVDELTSYQNEAGKYLFEIADLNTDDWEVVTTVEDAESGTVTTLYRYSTTVDQSDAKEDLSLNPIFTTIKVSEELTAADVEALGTKTITVTSYAVQAANLEQAEADALAQAELMGSEETTDEG